MKSTPVRIVGPVYWVVTFGLLAAVTAMMVWWTPREETMGDVQKVFYIHLPAAINTFVACFVVFIASVMYLLQRRSWWDDLGFAAAKVAVLLASIVLLTGMIWGRSAWGAWWQWTPRLTFSLILWLLYVVYLMIRPSIESSQRRALICAVYGVIAFMDVPLVWLSTKLLPDIHPKSISMAPEMRLTLLAWFVPMTMLAAGLLVASMRINRLQRAASEPAEELDEPRLVPAGGQA
ncbi:MAG: cytochrome c biogenesis protein CcsA [Phycisphaerales bacterium]|nr:cytochrome c biogenesis protein CcsA [Phycisphaerales bacterium]